MKQQLTAVEYIKKRIEEDSDTSFLNIDWNKFDEIINKAKEMEKEQIIKSNYDGIKFGWEDAINEFKSKVGMINKSTEELSEQYYNETFKQQEQ